MNKNIILIIVVIVAVASLTGNLYQNSVALKASADKEDLNKKITDLSGEISDLNKKVLDISGQVSESDQALKSSETKFKILDEKVKKYLAYQKISCDSTAESCLDDFFKLKGIQPVVYKAQGGMCLVRDSYSSMPSESDPDVGKGYAKMTKAGINTDLELQQACTKEDFASLLQAYCQKNKNSVQFLVSSVNDFGAPSSGGQCSTKYGCGLVGCPPGS